LTMPLAAAGVTTRVVVDIDGGRVEAVVLVAGVAVTLTFAVVKMLPSHVATKTATRRSPKQAPRMLPRVVHTQAPETKTHQRGG
jgi:hypothetical protein